MNIKLKKIFFLISKIIGINIGFPIISKNIVKLQDDDKNIFMISRYVHDDHKNILHFL